MAILNFNVNEVEKRENSYELLPAGWYTAQITESDIVPLNSGNGDALKLTFEVLTEGYRNRKLWTRMNIRHNNPQAESIAKQQLRELCESVGLASLPDSNLLHYKPVQVRVKIRKDDTGRYEDQNEIAGYKPVSQTSQLLPAAPAARQSTPPAVPSAAPAAPTQPPVAPWLKGKAA